MQIHPGENWENWGDIGDWVREYWLTGYSTLKSVPKEFDDIRRRNAAMGTKPIDWAKYVNNRGPGGLIKFTKEEFEQADKDNELLYEYIDKGPAPTKRTS